MRILLVEDDDLLGNSVKTGLQQEGYGVDWLRDGYSAELALQTETFDTIILDIGLPKRNGLDVLRGLRARGLKTPVIIVSSNGRVEDRIRGLDLGADDYLPKPFDFNELCARIRALLRRSSGRSEPILAYGPITLDPAAHSVMKDEQRIDVSPKEFSLLRKLLESAGRVLSREQLSETLYGWDNEIDSNAVEVHIHNLRKKLGDKLIRTIRGVGYMIDKID